MRTKFIERNGKKIADNEYEKNNCIRFKVASCQLGCAMIARCRHHSYCVHIALLCYTKKTYYKDTQRGKKKQK